MTKRRAESSSLQESPPPPPPQKMKKSVCDAERELEAVHALHAADTSPALFTTLVGERRRKRPRCCEDREQLDRTEAPGGKMSTDRENVKKEIEGECVSGKFRSASDACTCEMASEESASGSKVDRRTKATLPDDNEDELCEFNSFQFWRNPLPALDLSLLDAPSTTELSRDSSLKDSTEEMET
ncbi:hypothetical protein KOW79_018314 [Hemibagrus wyckioides]|uniref:Putative WW-binding domain-containing protein n=1 Tax=Hemibagrus wyckioides TaxID=337641 RepID=A0A9D3SGX8_9TELE|nr:hypothetical protein KOW79_018314 [Hemibagrus wyckioides]